MNEFNWLDSLVATHKCVHCGALWRFDRPEDSILKEGSWHWKGGPLNAQPCCDNVEMGKQIIPATFRDIENYINQQLINAQINQNNKG